ncbi:TPA: DNA helicase UvrD [Neisseria meningitidis]
MDAKHRLKKYVYHLLVAIDQLFNALTGGAADETLSSRTYRGARLAQKPKTRWKILYTLINGVFFDRQHCRQAYISELKGRQHDARFNQSRAAGERDTQ